MSSRCSQVCVVLGLASVLVIIFTGPAAAQIPDTFTNLKLLEPDIEKGQLVGIMRAWAGGLGVRCNYCHVGPDNLEGMDFASDEKAAKRTARRMLELSRTLNGQLLSDLPTVEEGRSHQVVSCYTCHRGLPRPPEQLAVQLSGIYEERGIDAAIAEYRDLREEYYGSGRYDFSPRAIQGFAQWLAETDRPTDAATFLQVGIGLYPESADLYAALGMALGRGGHRDEALAALDRALELDPENRLAQIGRRQLGAGRERQPERE